MKNDPIVEEVHQIRETLLEECNGSLSEMMERMKVIANQEKNRVVRLETGSRVGSNVIYKDKQRFP